MRDIDAILMRAALVAIGIVFAVARARAQEHDAAEHAQHAMHEVQESPQDSQTTTPQAAPSGGSARAPVSHVPPPPPEHPMGQMGGREMTEAMEMDDAATFAMLKVDRMERGFDGNAPSFMWSADAWIGGDFNKLRLRSEGEQVDGEPDRADLEGLWSHAVGTYWNGEIGVRHDFGRGPDRNWVAFGVRGLSPYWFGLAATAYVGQGGRTATRVEGEYELSLTQQWILQSRAAVNAYGQSDPASSVGAGLADAVLGLRLRYEIRREFAPYLGIEWSRRFGQTATLARNEGLDVDDTRIVAGLRIWY